MRVDQKDVRVDQKNVRVDYRASGPAPIYYTFNKEIAKTIASTFFTQVTVQICHQNYMGLRLNYDPING